MITLSSDRLQLLLHEPLDGFYKGTRFDRAGIFDSILFGGIEMAGDWYPHYDPFMHDAVKGPAEEFSPVFPAIPGHSRQSRELFLKPGVGILLKDKTIYDRFRLYEVIDGGVWETAREEDHILFRHTIKGIYEYEKEIALTGDNSFEIRHHLLSEVPLEGEVYNHNFFTFGKLSIGPGREIDFPFCPVGEWRKEYDSVGFTHSGIRFTRDLNEGETVYAGDIHTALKDGMKYNMTLRDGPLSVSIKGSVPVTRAVFWSSSRVACIEPYNAFRAAPGKPFTWTICYSMEETIPSHRESL